MKPKSQENIPYDYSTNKEIPANTLAQTTENVKLDLSSTFAQNFKATLTEEFKMPADFNGHYKVASIGCGTACFGYVVMDKNTGKIYMVPDGNDYGSFLAKNDWTAYSLNSNLIKTITDNGSKLNTYSFDGTNFLLVSTTSTKAL